MLLDGPATRSQWDLVHGSWHASPCQSKVVLFGMAHYSATSAVGKVSLLHGSYGRPDTKPNVYSCTVPKTLDIGMAHFKHPEN